MGRLFVCLFVGFLISFVLVNPIGVRSESHKTYDIHITFVDVRNVSIKNMLVIVYNNNSNTVWYGYTDHNGRIYIQNNGTYEITAIWCGIEVYNNSVNVSDEDITIKINLYLIRIKVVDKTRSPLPYAVVSISKDDREIFSRMCDSNGIIQEELPKDIYHIGVEWQGVKVYSDEMLLGIEDPTEIICDVYDLHIIALDSHNLRVGGANVYIYSISNNGQMVTGNMMTDTSGQTTIRLPKGQYLMRIYYAGKRIYENSSLEIAENTSLKAICDIYYLAIKVVDGKGAIVEPCYITVIGDSGTPYFGKKTDASGIATFRLVADNYTVTAMYRGEYMFSEIDMREFKRINLNSDKNVTIKLDDYPPRFYTTNAFVIASGTLLLIILFSIPLYNLIKARKKGKKPN